MIRDFSYLPILSLHSAFSVSQLILQLGKTEEVIKGVTAAKMAQEKEYSLIMFNL